MLPVVEVLYPQRFPRFKTAAKHAEKERRRAAQVRREQEAETARKQQAREAELLKQVKEREEMLQQQKQKDEQFQNTVSFFVVLIIGVLVYTYLDAIKATIHSATSGPKSEPYIDQTSSQQAHDTIVDSDIRAYIAELHQQHEQQFAPLCSTAPATGIEITETFPVVRRSPPPVTQAQAPAVEIAETLPAVRCSPPPVTQAQAPAVEIAETLPAVRCSPPPVTQAQGPVLPTHAPPFETNADSDETQSNAHAQVIQDALAALRNADESLLTCALCKEWKFEPCVSVTIENIEVISASFASLHLYSFYWLEMYPAIERISNAVVQALDVLDDVLRTGKQLVIAIVDFAKAVYGYDITNNPTPALRLALMRCLALKDVNERDERTPSPGYFVGESAVNRGKQRREWLRFWIWCIRWEEYRGAVFTLLSRVIREGHMGLLIESGILLGLRLALFFSCRKYLLRSLYSDLRNLSVESQSDSTLTPGCWWESSIVNILIPKSLFTRSSAAEGPSSSSTNYPDLITRLLADFLSLINADVDLEELAWVARQVSLVLVGVIVLSSIRMVLRGVGRVLRSKVTTSKNLGASLMLLILAQLMGIYLLSTIVQMRILFPPTMSFTLSNASSMSEIEATESDVSPETQPTESVPGDTNLFSTIPPFEVFGRLFDWSFLCRLESSLAAFDVNASATTPPSLKRQSRSTGSFDVYAFATAPPSLKR
ncbi:hypothetical protein K435DRAFT_874795 [Dendrothele bispora CBS 962.96]|uniref:Abscisic acid G-protein coupled receptor-like domain-containing protein n=1 Tax=Dendrothele bispora (strain CBS 962.96) TaxID=1314807 RepID=A0A4S8KVV9_DENBC|nr:hypothetical protein K435DRAFT_874795 [Dendrothele bispora CBS 962.96]